MSGTEKPIALLGTDGTLSIDPFSGIDRIFAHTGLNTGNVAFFYSVRSHIANNVKYVPWEFDPKVVNSECSAFIMPAANMINSFQDHGKLAERFERLEIPVAIVGLGTQLPLGAAARSLEIKEGTKKFINVLARIGAKVGCRGATTKDFLASQGLEAEVIGCPSNFANPRLDLGKVVSEKYGGLERGLFGHCDFNQRLAGINEKIVSWIGKHGGMICVQDPGRGFKFAMRDPATVADPEVLKEASLIFRTSPEELRDKIIDKLVVFADYPSWLVYSQTFSLSIGTRMHGNMIAFQAGVPTVLVPHDERVGELAKTMMMPTVSMESVRDAASLPELLKKVSFDADGYDANRRRLARIYFKILSDIGIRIKDSHVALAA